MYWDKFRHFTTNIDGAVKIKDQNIRNSIAKIYGKLPQFSEGRTLGVGWGVVLFLPTLHSSNSTGVCACYITLQSCLTLCNPMDCSPPGFSAHGILQARILGWMAMPSSRASCQHRDWTHVSHVSCTGRQLLYYCITWEAPRNSHHLLINIPVTKSSTNLPSLLQPFAWDL